jgi:hypothetical protein
MIAQRAATGKPVVSSGRSGDHSLRQTGHDLDPKFAAENSVRIDQWRNCFLRYLALTPNIRTATNTSNVLSPTHLLHFILDADRVN